MVLVCDDQPDVLVALELLLKDAGYRSCMTDSPGSLLAELSRGEERFDLVLTDMNFARDTTSGREGLDLVQSICRLPEHPPVVVMTAWADIDLAMEAVRRGAADFVRKPWDNAKLLASLERAVAHTRGLGRSEMEAARLVQERLLPRRDYQTGRLRFQATFAPAGDVGGDYYDYFDLGSGNFSFLLADVSGKGVPAAMLMANLQALFHAQDPRLLASPAEVVERINGLFFRSTAPAHYATIFYACYREAAGEIVYVNCGNPPAVLHAPGGALPERFCHATGLPIGLFASSGCSEVALPVDSGHRLVVSSDGITEADVAVDDQTQIIVSIGVSL